MANETPYDMLGITETTEEIQTPTENLVDFQETVTEGDTMGAMNMLPRSNVPVEAEQRPPPSPSVAPPVQSNMPPVEPQKEINQTAILQNHILVANAIKGITPKVVQEGIQIAEVKQDEARDQAKAVKLADMLQQKMGRGLPQNAMNFDPQNATPEDRGLMGMAASMPTQSARMGGGVNNFAGQVPGQGHGMEDNVFMPIVERNRGKQVATLAVSPDEYVLDAHTMSALGNGSADEGARYMDGMVKNIRKKAYGTDKQPNQINGLASLRPMIERV